MIQDIFGKPHLVGMNFFMLKNRVIGNPCMFELFYSIICGVGIALYRILLIKLNLWVKSRLGEATLFYAIFFVGILISCSIAAIKYSLDSYHLADKNCMMVPGKYLLTILDEHQQGLGEFPTYQYLIQFRKFH